MTTQIDQFFEAVAEDLEAIRALNREHRKLYNKITDIAAQFDLSKNKLEEEHGEDPWVEIDRLDEVASALGEQSAFDNEWGSNSEQPSWWTPSTC